jgi:hypothetical protein
MSGAGDRRLERWLDLAVYAPIGLALQVRDELPTWISTGKQAAQQRLTVARFVGEMAVRYARGELEKQRRLSAHHEATQIPAEPLATASDTIVALPFEGYDTLPASAIVQRLARSSPAERRRVAVYESATRRRRTILSKIEQLGA